MRIDFQSTKIPHHSRETKIELPPFFKKIGMLIVGLGIVVGILFLLLSLFQTGGSDHPYAYALVSLDSSKERKGGVVVLWIDEQRRILSQAQVPDTLEYHSPLLGSYPFSSLYSAYQTVKDPTVMTTELSIFLRTRILGAFAVSQSSQVFTKQSLFSFTLRSCLHRTATSPKIGECIHLLSLLLSPSFTLREESFPTPRTGPNALGIVPFDRQGYGVWLSDHFPASFGFTGQSLAIINASGVSGVGKQAATVFGDLGFSVLSVSDGSSIQKKGKLIAKDETTVSKKLLLFLSSFFRVEYEQNGDLPERSRTQFVFVIGEEQAVFFTP